MRLIWFVFIFLFKPIWSQATPIQMLGIESLSEKEKTKFHLWLQHGLDAVQHTLGPLPQATLPVRLKTKWYATEPVPWGQVERGRYNTGDGLYLVVYRYAKPHQLKYDWTLYHEISHLYLPYLDSNSLWLSEGFATFMQNIVLLQNGIYDRETFIEKLSAGLKRGKNNTQSATGPLSKVTDAMRKNRAFMRVYWTGTAFFIEVDLALHRQGKSLPAIIKAFSTCCRAEVDTGKQLALTLDKASRRLQKENSSLVFSPLYFQYRDRVDFPNIAIESLYQLAEHYRPAVVLE